MRNQSDLISCRRLLSLKYAFKQILYNIVPFIWILFIKLYKLTKVYYMGCGIACFLRILVAFYIGLKDKANIVYSIKTILFYNLLVSLFFSFLMVLGSRQLGKLFLSSDKELDAFKVSMNIFALHLPFCTMLASMNTIFR